MSAEAGVFHESVALRHRLHAVPEEPARVAHLLCEALLVRETIGGGWKNERMPTADADVFMHAVAVREPDVGVVAEEARERMADVRGPSVFGQVVRSTPAAPASVLSEYLVVDDMSPQRAAHSHPQRCRAHVRICEFDQLSGSPEGPNCVAVSFLP